MQVHFIGQCSDLPGLDHGTVSFDFSPMPMRPYGTTATYTCNVGFELSVDVVRMCVNGTWTGSAPTCGMYVGKL